MPNSFFCVAYGGASIICPPGHTMESLKKGIEVGAGMLAVELRATRDGEIVIGTSMQRLVAEEPVFIADKTLAEWQRITTYDDVPMVTLDEVLALASLTRCGLMLDVRVHEIERSLARKLRKSGISYDSLMLTIESDASRTIMRSLDPKLPIAHRFKHDETAKIDASLLSSLDVQAVVWPSAVLRPELVKTLTASGVIVYAGVVQLAQEMRRLVDICGVDGIVTPYPDLLLTMRQKIGKAA